ncbi:MAG: serine hydrolase [Candidatus Saccharimonadales bacterium]
MTTKSVAAKRHRAHYSASVGLKWLKKYQRVLDIAGVCLVILAALSVVAQFLYPNDRALPMLSVGGFDIGGKDRVAIVAQLTEYAETGELSIHTPSREWITKWQSAGVSIDAEASADAMLAYEWWERLIPFSGALHVWQSQDLALIAIADEERLQAFAEQIVREDSQAAFNATISVKDGRVHIDDAKNGYKFTLETVMQQVRYAPVTAHTEVQLQPEDVPFARSRQQLESLQAEAEAILSQQLRIKVRGQAFSPDRKAVGAWLQFVEDEQSKQLSLQFDHEAMKAYLQELNHAIGVDPGDITVTLLDGQEIARTSAPQGQSIAMDKAIQQIETALKNPLARNTLGLQVVDAPPNASYVRTYSQASSGLQAIIEDWERQTYGTFGVVVREIGGQNRYAQWQPERPFVTASTFKMFVAYAMLTKIDRGEITFNQKTDMGWTVDACLKEMIHRSTNPCAISLLNLLGWEKADAMIKAAGFTATYLNNKNGGDKHSTVRDETNFLLRLHSRTLMSEHSTNYLLNLMKRQIWRDGIPAGVPRGTVVANKVGRYNGYVHDVAIVYGPKSTYIIGVMSKGGTYANFANLSRRVYNFFNN